MQDIYLILENKTVFKGKSFGACKEAVGEVVFTTSMVGYIETLTDPSYYGQIVVQTFPQIGNYGMINEDVLGDKSYIKGFIVREKCDNPSNFRCEGTLEEYLKDKDIPAIYGIDTRLLTKIIRENGVMNGKISFTADFDENLKDYKIIDAVSQLSCKEEIDLKTDNPAKNVVAFDFGATMNIEKELINRNCNVTVVPYNTTYDRIKELNPDGIVLTGGAGNPADNIEVIENLKKICELKIPMFAFGLSHQMLAISQGAKTEKLHYGHRGASQPVINTETKHTFATNQNHGYTVKTETLPKTATVIYKNVNDNSCEGIKYTNIPAFSIEFYPETGDCPLDAEFMTDRFMKLLEV